MLTLKINNSTIENFLKVECQNDKNKFIDNLLIYIKDYKRKENTKKMKLSKKTQEELEEQVKSFNKEHKSKFKIRFRGKFIYLDKVTLFRTTHIGRLKYNGSLDTLSFAVYKYSNNSYNANEFFFPGMDQLNGNINGAMKAGLELC
jgi:hypothetical protein